MAFQLSNYDRIIKGANVWVQIDVMCHSDGFSLEFVKREESGPRIRGTQNIKCLLWLVLGWNSEIASNSTESMEILSTKGNHMDGWDVLQ